ncbi:hypothetical protein AKJ16_DCAP12996 [Drosera capensis]
MPEVEIFELRRVEKRPQASSSVRTFPPASVTNEVAAVPVCPHAQGGLTVEVGDGSSFYQPTWKVDSLATYNSTKTKSRVMMESLSSMTGETLFILEILTRLLMRDAD